MSTFLKISLCLFLFFPSFLFAQEQRLEIQNMFQEDSATSEAELNATDPKIVPGNFLYPFKQFLRNTSVFFTFSKEKKFIKELKRANEEILEIRKLIAKEKDITQGTRLYTKQLERVKNAYEHIPEEKKEDFLKNMLDAQVKHQMIVERFHDSEKKEIVRKEQLEFMESLFENTQSDQIQESLREALKEIQGSKLKGLYHLHLLRALQQSTSNQAVKDALLNASGSVFLDLQENLQKNIDGNLKEDIDSYVELLTKDDLSYIEFMSGLRKASSSQIRPLFDELEMRRIHALEQKLLNDASLKERIKQNPQKRMMIKRLPIREEIRKEFE